MLTYEVPPHVQHVVFSMSGQTVAFVAKNHVYVYVLANTRSGIPIEAERDSSWMNASLSDQGILIRCNQQLDDVTSRVVSVLQ